MQGDGKSSNYAKRSYLHKGECSLGVELTRLERSEAMFSVVRESSGDADTRVVYRRLQFIAQVYQLQWYG